MSYDVCLEMDTGGPERAELGALDRNYTYNVGAMFLEAMGMPLGALHDTPCTHAGIALRRGVAAMESDPDKYQAMNPENGWGDYDGALDFLRACAEGCENNPRAVFCVY